MRIFLWLCLSIALAMTLVAAQAGGATSNTTSAKPTDEPNAIDDLLAPVAPIDSTGAEPTGDIGNRLAVAAHQLEVKEYADAATLLNGIVSDVERATSRYDPALVAPLTMLGDALGGASKYKDALSAYQQARHITRITDGLHTTHQVDLLYREADTYASMGKMEKANDRQEYAYATLLRNYGPVSPDLIPGIYHLAAWYQRTSNPFGARDLYERAVEILERNKGATDASLIEALRGLAKSYKDEAFPLNELHDQKLPGALPPTDLYGPNGQPVILIVNRFGPGEVALLEVVKITTANPNATPLDVALEEIDLADWYLLFDKETRAIPVYVHARQIMRERAGMNDDQIAVYFGQPTVLYRPIPDNPSAPPEALRSNPTQGHVELGYIVTELGHVEDMKTVSSEPEGMMDLKVRRGFRVARFRPRFDGDNPVISSNQIYRYTFTYFPRPEDSVHNAEHTDHTKPTDAAQPAG